MSMGEAILVVFDWARRAIAWALVWPRANAPLLAQRWCFMEKSWWKMRYWCGHSTYLELRDTVVALAIALILTLGAAVRVSTQTLHINITTSASISKCAQCAYRMLSGNWPELHLKQNLIIFSVATLKPTISVQGSCQENKEIVLLLALEAYVWPLPLSCLWVAFVASSLAWDFKSSVRTRNQRLPMGLLLFFLCSVRLALSASAATEGSSVWNGRFMDVELGIHYTGSH